MLKAQVALGLPVAPTAIADYERELDNIDLDAIRQRELVTKHDVKARLDEFCAIAGHQDLHKGLTSRDVTENVEQLLSYQALQLVRGRLIGLLDLFAELAVRFAGQPMVARTHNVPAQPTTMGKRFASLGEELLAAFDTIDDTIRHFALRGIKGPVGSQQDQIDLLGNADNARALEASLARDVGIDRVLGSVGQVYPRSLDFRLVSSLVQVAAAPANLALLVRLMAGHDLATEGFQAGQVGSSAMPHKMNTRSCERISGLAVILKGHLAMAAGLSGEQWNEGDVSCSVVRRVVLPDAFFALDGLIETTFSVLNNFGIFPAVIDAELRRYLPFLATPSLLMHAVRAGLGREEGHELIKTHAVASALAMRENTDNAVGLIARLGDDDAFPGTADELGEILSDPRSLLGAVDAQVAEFAARVAEVVATDVNAASYRGADIL
ncbi:MAG: lyase family protein [Acidimicrobiales bacterium]